MASAFLISGVQKVRFFNDLTSIHRQSHWCGAPSHITHSMNGSGASVWGCVIHLTSCSSLTLKVLTELEGRANVPGRKYVPLMNSWKERSIKGMVLRRRGQRKYGQSQRLYSTDDTPLVPTSNTSPHQRNIISILVKLSISIQCIQKKLYITSVFCEWGAAALRGFSGMPQQRMEGRSGLAELQQSSLLFAESHSELCKRWWSASKKGFKVTAVGEGGGSSETQ